MDVVSRSANSIQSKVSTSSSEHTTIAGNVCFPTFLEKLLNTDLAHESDTEKILKLDEAAKAVAK